MKYCEIIFIHWTFNFVYFVGWAIHHFKIPLKYFFNLVILGIIGNPRIKVFTNMSIIIKPRNFDPMKLNDFAVFLVGLNEIQLPGCKILHTTRKSACTAVNTCHVATTCLLGRLPWKGPSYQSCKQDDSQKNHILFNVHRIFLLIDLLLKIESLV